MKKISIVLIVKKNIKLLNSIRIRLGKIKVSGKFNILKKTQLFYDLARKNLNI